MTCKRTIFKLATITFVTPATRHLVYIPKNISLEGAPSFIEGALY